MQSEGLWEKLVDTSRSVTDWLNAVLDLCSLHLYIDRLLKAAKPE
jgi:hypothetical protein